MRIYNGTFSFRIWVIGTRRMLRVVDQEGDNFNDIEQLPRSLAEPLRPFKAHLSELFGRSVFAKYKVCAFTRSRPGVMQSVNIVDAKEVRITSGDE